MQDIRIDDLGNERCWKCGGQSFTQQRTTRAKVGLGVGAVFTKPKLRCVTCGEYNDVGSPRKYTQPSSAKYRTKQVGNAGGQSDAVSMSFSVPASASIQSGGLDQADDPRVQLEQARRRLEGATRRLTAIDEETRSDSQKVSDLERKLRFATVRAKNLDDVGKHRQARKVEADEVRPIKATLSQVEARIESARTKGQYGTYQRMIVQLPALIESLERTVAELPSVELAEKASNDAESPTTLVADEIRKLGELRVDGLITDDEFAAQKAKLLGL